MNFHTETFSVSQHLIGLALGTFGSNLRRARTLKGIVSVYFDEENLTFTVTGHNKEIVKIVQNFLEYTELEQSVSRNRCDFLRHNDDVLQTLIDKCGLVRVEIHDNDGNKPYGNETEYVTLKYVGLHSCIDEAKSFTERLWTSAEYSEFQLLTESERESHAKFVQQFKVSSDVLNLALGTNGSRLEDANKLSGIIEIIQKDEIGYSTFTIYGTSDDSVKIARDKLEIVKEETYIPRNKVGLLIGPKGANIRDIIKETKVYQIHVKDSEVVNGNVPVVLIGNPSQVEAAKASIREKL